MIRKLSTNDKSEYIDHIKKTFYKKGSSLYLTGVDLDKELSMVEDFFKPFVIDEDGVSKNSFHIWAEFDSNNKITQSFNTFYFHKGNNVSILNYKSVGDGPFKPKEKLLPLLDQVFKFFEEKKVFTFYLLRRVGFFEWRKNIFFEDSYPLNRYNCYFDEIIPANTQSDHANSRNLACGNIFPVDTGIVCMSLKQEFRKYDNVDYSILPDTKENFYLQKSKKNICIIGYNPTTNKVGNSLYNIYSKNHNVKTLGRHNFEFTNAWDERLIKEINNLSHPLILIINLFDYSNMKLQEEIFKTLWKKYKMYEGIHFVVLGSLAHYADKNLISENYYDAKESLCKSCYELAIGDVYLCKLLLIEPGVIQSYILNNKPNWPSSYITDDELANKILLLIDSNDKFMSVSIIGNHRWQTQ